MVPAIFMAIFAVKDDTHDNAGISWFQNKKCKLMLYRVKRRKLGAGIKNHIENVRLRFPRGI